MDPLHDGDAPLPGERGFSLIEVVIALALLATVLLTISGLFLMGRQTVGTGRDLTEATSLANDILEEMNTWGFSLLYTNFGKGATDAAFSVDSKTNSYAQRWQSEIDKRLPNAQATIAITPIGGGTFEAANGMRARVTVQWVLKARTRRVGLETVRF
jgi:prepilin-type N-terminal cleavage/methylation domain-containing protein